MSTSCCLTARRADSRRTQYKSGLFGPVRTPTHTWFPVNSLRSNTLGLKVRGGGPDALSRSVRRCLRIQWRCSAHEVYSDSFRNALPVFIERSLAVWL